MIEVPKSLTERVTSDFFEAMRPVIATVVKQAYQEGYIAGHAVFAALRQSQNETALKEWVKSTRSFGIEMDERWLEASKEAATRTNREKGFGYIELVEVPEEAQFGGTVVYLHGSWSEDPETITPFLRHRYQVFEEQKQKTA